MENYDNNDTSSNDEEYQYDNEFSFELDLPSSSINTISIYNKRHKSIGKFLELPPDSGALNQIFIVVSSLCDPFTQPEENDQIVLSLDLITDLLIALTFNYISSENAVSAKEEIIPTPYFDLSYQFSIILEAITKKLNCNDESILREVINDEKTWEDELKLWTPRGIKNHDLRLVYMVACVLTLGIYKLYSKSDNLCLNPFLGYFLNSWKCHTAVISLGLEIDRRDEESNGPGTPEIVKEVIRGSSAIRTVLASVLNNNLAVVFHDFQHESLLTFMNPLSRRVSSGSLSVDMRWYVTALLALGSNLMDVTDLLNNLEPDDKFDEDIKYMFDYEYEDAQDDDNQDDVESHSEISTSMSKRCNCIFDDQDYGIYSTLHNNNTNLAVRTKTKFEFDEHGRDWRDVPRGENVFFNEKIDLSDSNCFKWDELSGYFDRMSETAISDKVGQKVIDSIARGVKLEYEEQIMLAELGDEARRLSELQKENDLANGIDNNEINPDKVYDRWSYDWIFEPIMRYNPQIASSMMDEMLMAHGYRRVLIWFITHLELSQALINYIHELLIGARGCHPTNKFTFSRKGILVLSEVEKEMLLHEFFSNSALYLSRGFESNGGNSHADVENALDSNMNRIRGIPTPTIAKKLIDLICLMVRSLIDKQIIRSNDQEYKNEIQTLLFQWIGKSESAKKLYFELNNNDDTKSNNNDNDNDSKDRNDDLNDDLLANFDNIEQSRLHPHQEYDTTKLTLEEIEFLDGHSSLFKHLLDAAVSDPNTKSEEEMFKPFDFNYFIKNFKKLSSNELVSEQLFKNIANEYFQAPNFDMETTNGFEGSDYNDDLMSGEGIFKNSNLSDKDIGLSKDSSGKKKKKKNKKNKKKR